MGGKTTQKNETVTKPPAWLDPYWQGLMGQTNRAVNSVDRSPHTGPVVAGRNQYDDQSLALASQIIGGNTLPAGTFTNMIRDVAGGKFLDPATNPTLQGNINAAQAPVMEQLQRQILPGLKGQSIGMNAFGSDRSMLREGQAIGDTTEALGRIAAEMIGENYNRERQYQMMAPELFQQAFGAEMLPMAALAQLGDTERMLQQLGINDVIGSRQLNATLPFLGLDTAAQIFGAAPYSTSTSTQTTKQQPGAADWLKGGLGIASLASGMGWLNFLKPAAAGAAALTPAQQMFTGSLASSGGPW
jgi:hypothetical protein